MRKTGIFFHYQDGERLRDFPLALGELLSKPNVFLFDAYYPLKPSSAFDLDMLPLEAVRSVHSAKMIEQVRRSGVLEGVLLSVSGTVSAAFRIWKGEIDNAFVFTGYGDHHAGTDFFGGGCYFNGAAVAISEMRRSLGVKRFAIIDTDAHHGDGTWEVFRHDRDVLYMCFCPGRYGAENNKIDVQTPWRISDSEYLSLLRENFSPLAASFQPEIIFWNWGYDGTTGDYGDLGLTPESHAGMAGEIKRVADTICNGRLIVVLCGGSRRDLARYIIPRIIEVLANEGS